MKYRATKTLTAPLALGLHLELLTREGGKEGASSVELARARTTEGWSKIARARRTRTTTCFSRVYCLVGLAVCGTTSERRVKHARAVCCKKASTSRRCGVRRRSAALYASPANHPKGSRMGKRQKSLIYPHSCSHAPATRAKVGGRAWEGGDLVITARRRATGSSGTLNSLFKPTVDSTSR
jgi:hypothetical protein